MASAQTPSPPSSSSVCPALPRHQPISVISDTFCEWSVDVVAKLGIFHAVLTTCGAQFTVATFSMWLHLLHLKSDSDEFELPGFPEIRVHRSQLNASSKAADATDYFCCHCRSDVKSSLRSSCMLVNSVEEIETKEVEPLFNGTDQESRKRNGSPTGSISTHPVQFFTFPFVRSAPSLLLRWRRLPWDLWVVWLPVKNFRSEEEIRSPEWLPKGFEERTRERKQGLIEELGSPTDHSGARVNRRIWACAWRWRGETARR